MQILRDISQLHCIYFNYNAFLLYHLRNSGYFQVFSFKLRVLFLISLHLPEQFKGIDVYC